VVRERRSLSSNSEKIAAREKSWTRFEMDSLESPSLPKREEKADFVSLQIEGKKGGDFIPLQESGDDYKKRRQAEDILKEAQEKAAFLEQEAYEKGFAQGEKDGLELGEKKGLKVVEAIENLFTEISHLKEEILTQYEKGTLELIFAIAKKIIHHQISSDEKAIKETVFNALHLAAEKSKIILRVNPEDLDYVERLRPEVIAKFKEMKSITVTSDPSITRGGCFLETPYGDIDARIEAQLDKIYQSLEEARDKGSGLDI
jgi:flagellar assembly protein FliH